MAEIRSKHICIRWNSHTQEMTIEFWRALSEMHWSKLNQFLNMVYVIGDEESKKAVIRATEEFLDYVKDCNPSWIVHATRRVGHVKKNLNHERGYLKPGCCPPKKRKEQ